ncbi:MAG: hypothetical protein QXV17_10490 [Candidatus Micrarchaeaceae archaeon]
MTNKGHLEEELKKRAAQQPKYLSVTELPNKIEVKILSFEFKTDKKGQEACFITLITRKGEYIVQKYTKSTYEDLFNTIEAAGGEAYLSSTFTEWRLERRGRSINPRLYPAPKVK